MMGSSFLALNHLSEISFKLESLASSKRFSAHITVKKSLTLNVSFLFSFFNKFFSYQKWHT